MLAELAAMTTLLVAQDPIETRRLVDNVARLQGEFKECLTAQTVALGQNNAESAETVLRAVSSICLPVETELRLAYDRLPLSRAHVEELMRRDRKLGEDAGVAGLLVARASASPSN